MTNLGKLIEKRLKAVALEKAKDSAILKYKQTQAERDEIRGDLAVVQHAVDGTGVPLWTRRLAMEKRQRELVAGGDILWKPVDSTARRVIQKAPWWSFPIPVSNYVPPVDTPKPGFNQPLLVPKKPKPPMKNSTNVVERVPKDGAYEGQQITTQKPNEQLNAEIASEFVKRSGTALDKTSVLLEKAMDACAAMDAMCDYWKESWVDFQDTSDKRLTDFRMFRMAMDTEIRQLMAGIRDVRQFFLDKDYEKERDRLKEFVELCERLKALKESGFLDTVAETMLTLSIKPNP